MILSRTNRAIENSYKNASESRGVIADAVEALGRSRSVPDTWGRLVSGCRDAITDSILLMDTLRGEQAK